MEFLTNRIVRALWPHGPHDAGPVWLSIWTRLGRYTYALSRDYLRGDLSLRAMSLVYTTMLAIVPLLALSLATVTGLGLDEDLKIKVWLADFLAPIGNAAEVDNVVTNLTGFVNNASAPAIVSIGIILLLLSALSMAQKVELSFNYVWRVDRPRSFARRFSEYLSVMLVGPLIMLVAITSMAGLASISHDWLSSTNIFGFVAAKLGALTPTFVVIIAFTFLNAFVPNTRVRLKPAIIGGLFAGLVWAASGKVFLLFVASSSNTLQIYSGFAIVILTMLWLYVSWLVLLLGAQLAFYVQNPEYLRLGQRAEYLSNGLRERLALGAMLLIATDFEKPGHGWRMEGLAARIRTPRHHLEPVLAALMDAELVTETAEHRLLPGRDIRRIAIADILMAVRNPGGRISGTPSHDWNPTIGELVERIERSITTSLEGHSLADLVDEDEKRGAIEPPPRQGNAPKREGVKRPAAQNDSATVPPP